MKTVATATRNEYLSDTLSPAVTATLRRVRLDFGDTLYHYNTGGVTGDTGGDGFYDPLGHRLIWGDACSNPSVEKSTIRLGAKAAWTPAGAMQLYRSYSTPAADTWTMTSAWAPDYLDGYSRLGIYPVLGSESWYVWYADTSQSILRVRLSSGWGWSGKTPQASVGGFSAAAVHPVSESEAIVVYYEDPALRARYLKYTTLGGWTVGSEWTVYMSDVLQWSDTHWSDAEYIPGTSTIVVAVNLADGGAAHYILYDVASGIWSHPRPMLPSSEIWGNLRSRVSGLSTINGRLWAVVTKEPVTSDNYIMAPHTVLMSSVDGKNWSDEYFVSANDLRGKLCYATGNTYCHVVGNTSVARAEATNRIGYDASSLKATLPVTAFMARHMGTGTAPEVAVSIINESNPPPYADLVEQNNQLELWLGTESSPAALIQTGYLTVPQQRRQIGSDVSNLQSIGALSSVVGEAAYRPMAAKYFDIPHFTNSDFTLDSGFPQVYLRTHDGRWVSERATNVSTQRYMLKCERAGTAIAPHSFDTSNLMVRLSFMPTVSVEGIFLLFWWEKDDEEKEGNRYWRAGVYNDDGTTKLEIRRCWDGELDEPVASSAVTCNVDTWYTLYLDVRNDKVRVFFNGDDFNFADGVTYVEHSIIDTDLTIGPPTEYNIGIKVLDFEGVEGGFQYGTASGGESHFISDDDPSPAFDNDLLGKYVRCNGEDRVIGMVDATEGELWIAPPWNKVPENGDEYGLFEKSTLNGPMCSFRDLFLCEGKVPWSIAEIATNIFAQAGVIASEDTEYDVPLIGGTALHVEDLDVSLYSNLADTDLYFWCSTTEATGSTAFSGFMVRVGTNYTTLYNYKSLYAGNNAATLVAKHPNLKILPGSGTYKTIRIQAGKDLLFVSANGHTVAAFPMDNVIPSGYVWKGSSSVTGTARELSDMLDWVWDANTAAGGSLQQLLGQRAVRIVERASGEVIFGKFKTPLGDLGEYVDPVVSIQSGNKMTGRYALYEVEGQEGTAFYLDQDLARLYMRYQRVDNDSVVTTAQAFREAIRMSRMDAEVANTILVVLNAPDPAAELEDQFTLEGVDYVIDAVELALEETKDGPVFQFQVTGRQAPAAIDVGVYDTDYYDKGKEYG